LLEAITNVLSHPNFDRNLSHQIIFITTGRINPTAAIAFQEFNDYLKNKLKELPIQTVERDQLVHDLLIMGLEPFFALHKEPAFVAEFFTFYATVISDKPLSSFDVEQYSKKWLGFDKNKNIERLQVLFEASLFSSLLLKNDRYYDSLLILSAFTRTLAAWELLTVYGDPLYNYINHLLSLAQNSLATLKKADQNLLSKCISIGSIFYYPIVCSRSIELLALSILLSDSENPETSKLMEHFLSTEKGVSRILSENYSITILLVSLSLIKLRKIDQLKRYLINCTVWLCDRYSELGIAPFGSNRVEEFEQLLSEHLYGYQHQKGNTSFAASILLDLAGFLSDKDLYASIANDIRAVDLGLEFFHVQTDEALYSYDGKHITTTTDTHFSLELCSDYSPAIMHERKNCSISIRDKWLFLVIFLLRDRYFPTFIMDLVTT
jgi:hypothetical protein